MEGAGLLGGNQRGRRAGGECVLADSEPGRGSRGSERNRAPHEKIARTATDEDLTVSRCPFAHLRATGVVKALNMS